MKHLYKNSLIVKTYKSHTLLEKFRNSLTKMIQNSPKVELASDDFTVDILSTTEHHYSFYTATTSILPWLESMSEKFVGVDFTYEFISADQLEAGSYIINATNGTLGFSYPESKFPSTKSIRGFVNFLIYTMDKDPADVECHYSSELYDDRLNYSQITLSISESTATHLKMVSLVSPFTKKTFSKELPKEIFIDFEHHPFAVLKRIIHHMSKSFILLEGLSSYKKSFSIREVNAILTHFDLTDEGYSWESCREDFNLHAKYYGFTVDKRKIWVLKPLDLVGIIELLKNSQNGQLLAKQYSVENLSTDDEQLIIELASKCGFLHLENHFYLMVDYDTLY